MKKQTLYHHDHDQQTTSVLSSIPSSLSFLKVPQANHHPPHPPRLSGSKPFSLIILKDRAVITFGRLFLPPPVMRGRSIDFRHDLSGHAAQGTTRMKVKDPLFLFDKFQSGYRRPSGLYTDTGRRILWIDIFCHNNFEVSDHCSLCFQLCRSHHRVCILRDIYNLSHLVELRKI